MFHATDSVVLIVEDDRELAEEYAGWLADCETRIATDAGAAYELLDRDVDVVLLDRGLPDTPSAEVVGGIRARGGSPQIGLLSGTGTDSEVLRLDIDEYVPRPVTRDELRETVERLDDRKAVMGVVEKYLTLVARKRSLEARRDRDELADDKHYRELTGELAGRRQQISTLLSQLAESDPEGNRPSRDRERSGAEPDRSSAGGASWGRGFRPLYQTRKTEFYGMWFAAALTYGVGDVLSTAYATIAVPGLIEGNPVVDALLRNFGLSGFLVFKLLVFLVLISVSVQGARSRERFSYYWPPAVMTVLGIGLTGWNLRLILGG